MIFLQTNNLEKITKEHGLSLEEISSKAELLSEYLEKIEARSQGFYKITDDEQTIKKIEDFAAKVEGKYKHIVVLGIGGSALGAICLQQSLKTFSENEGKGNSARLHIIDNIDPIFLTEVEEIIQYDKTLFLVITKSGSTPETLAQYFYFRKRCEEKNLIQKEHFVFITDPEKGLLRKIAEEENIPSFEIPENVGGRFSVLTPVGLLPAKLIGIDIGKILEGAKKSRDQFLSKDFSTNLSFQLATIQFLLNQKCKTINVLMPYSQKLIRLADWYRQLLAESIGKKFNNEGKEVFTGITPINALGVTDQHSQSQLYNEGPNDKLIIFIEVEKLGPELPIPNLKPEAPEVSFLKNISFNKLLQTEKQGTEMALTENNRPNITIKIDEVSPETLGELFMFLEASIAFLGEFFNINAFDQPGVELSKNLTKELLSK